MVNKLSIIFLLALLPVLSCNRFTYSFAYNNAGWIAADYIDDFIELTDAQEAIVKKGIYTLLPWHRRTQLPLYKTFLEDLAASVGGRSISTDEIRQYWDRAFAFWKVLAGRLNSSAALLMSTVKPAQVDYLQKALAEHNSKYQELLAMSKQRRARRRFEKFTERLEEYSGELSPAQKNAIFGIYLSMPDTSQTVHAIRVERQQLMVSMIRRQADYGAWKQYMAVQLLGPSAVAAPAQKAELDAWRRAFLASWPQIHARLTVQQREHFKEKLFSLAAVVGELQE